MKDTWDLIKNELEQADPEITLGNMMRSPALCYRSKVFCFYYQSAMCFKLDESSAYFKQQYSDAEFLNPFKNKPPMKGWLVVPESYQHDWKMLAEHAFDNLATKT